MNYRGLVIALPKGRLMGESIGLLKQVGIDASALTAESADRKLIFAGEPGFLIVRPQDVAIYVSQGAADIGIVGNDVLREQELPVYEPLDLKIGGCRLSFAATPAFRRQYAEGKRDGLMGMRVATKYPRICSQWAQRKGLDLQILPLHGSLEIAPLTGFAESIVDLVSSGQTLKQNGLVEIETVLEVSARLIVNRASLKTTPVIAPLIRALKDVVA